MSRLTDELASHQSLLDELRSLRAADSYTLHEKVREVDRLRTEVEKVAGEVEVLKGVVEEGLRERRNRQERSQASIMDSEPHRQMQAPYETQEADPQTEGGEADDSEQEQETREEAREDTAESSQRSISPTPRTSLPIKPCEPIRLRQAPLSSLAPALDATSILMSSSTYQWK